MSGVERWMEVEGSARQRGEMQGAEARSLVRPALDALAGLPLFPRWLPMGSRRAMVAAASGIAGGLYLERHRQLLAARLGGRNLAWLEGMAATSGTAARTLYGINAFELESAHLGFSYGCTSLGLGGRHCADGRARLVYNHDFPPAFEPFLRIRRSRPRDGIASLALTYPTLVGAMAGLNEAGLAISYNQAYATDLTRRRPATFVTMVLQECLDRCGSVAEALDHILATPVTNGAMLTLVDRSGDRAVVEVSAGLRLVRREREQRVLYTFNKYRLEETSAVEIPVGAVTTGIAAGYDVHRCNLTRERRLLELDFFAEARNDEALLSLMADHDGGTGDEDTICRHSDPLSETIVSAILCPEAGTIRAVFGKPCSGLSATTFSWEGPSSASRADGSRLNERAQLSSGPRPAP